MATLDQPHGWNGGPHIFPISWDDHDVSVRLDVESDVMLVIGSMDKEDQQSAIAGFLKNPDNEIARIFLTAMGLIKSDAEKQAIVDNAIVQAREYHKAEQDVSEFEWFLPFTTRTPAEMQIAYNRVKDLTNDPEAMLTDLYNAMIDENYQAIEDHLAMTHKKVFDFYGDGPTMSEEDAKHFIIGYVEGVNAPAADYDGKQSMVHGLIVNVFNKVVD